MKSISTQLLITCAVIGAITLGILTILPTDTQAGSMSSKEWAKGNHCPYEGAECPNTQTYLRDYQIELYMDTIWIYDADRLVGTIVDPMHQFGPALDSIMLADNL